MWSPARLLSAASLCLTLASAYDKTACNNSPALCDKSYSQIWHLGAHDSAFVRNKTNNYSDAGNQYYNATVQLDAGVRLLQAQIHLNNNDIRLCHTTCTLFDFGSLEDYLQMVSDWMNSHESEVVTLLLVNDDKIPPSNIAKVFESTGLKNLTYTPTGISGPSTWPTLSSLIKDNARLITFLSTGADEASVGYMLDEFTYIFETPFDATDLSNITCTADRPSNVQGQTADAAKSLMGLQNHFLDQTVSASLNIQIPNETYASTLNSGSGAGNLAASISNCTKQWAWNGGFMLVDFFNEVRCLC
jgi:hypothetical protein